MKGIVHITFRSNERRDWHKFYLTGLSQTTTPSLAGITSRTPKWPSYTPTQHRYEICLFQKDPKSQEVLRMNCRFKDVAVTTQVNDADSRCSDPSCLRMEALGNHNQGNWDLL